MEIYVVQKESNNLELAALRGLLLHVYRFTLNKYFESIDLGKKQNTKHIFTKIMQLKN